MSPLKIRISRHVAEGALAGHSPEPLAGVKTVTSQNPIGPGVGTAGKIPTFPVGAAFREPQENGFILRVEIHRVFEQPPDGRAPIAQDSQEPLLGPQGALASRPPL